jgi:prepilin-type processing-associated H-X9-DG protein
VYSTTLFNMIDQTYGYNRSLPMQPAAGGVLSAVPAWYLALGGSYVTGSYEFLMCTFATSNTIVLGDDAFFPSGAPNYFQFDYLKTCGSAGIVNVTACGVLHLRHLGSANILYGDGHAQSNNKGGLHAVDNTTTSLDAQVQWAVDQNYNQIAP